MGKVRVGLIGCGFMGEMHANCYNALEGAEVVAVADLRRDHAEKLAKLSGAAIYNSADELLENAQVDLIDICLPTYLHCIYGLKAMDKVRYVFIEKPTALSFEEGRMLVEKSRKTGCQVQIGQVIRFWDEYVWLGEAIRDGRFGKVVNANFRRLSPRPTWGWENWLLDVKKSGGAGLDLHIHDDDIVFTLFGEPKSTCTIKNKIGEQNSYVNTICHYDDFVVSIEGTWDLPQSYPFNMYYRVVFENAVAEYDKGVLTVYDQNGSHQPELNKKDIGTAAVEGANISDLGGYYNELLYFTTRAAGGEKVEKATVEDGVRTLGFTVKELDL